MFIRTRENAANTHPMPMRKPYASKTYDTRYKGQLDSCQVDSYLVPLVYLFHISPKKPAPFGMDCSSKLALRAACLSLVGSRFIAEILLNLSPDWRIDR